MNGKANPPTVNLFYREAERTKPTNYILQYFQQFKKFRTLSIAFTGILAFFK